MKSIVVRVSLLLALLLLAGCSARTTTTTSQATSTRGIAPSPTPNGTPCSATGAASTGAAPTAAASLYLSSDDGFVYALTGADGSVRWKFDLGNAQNGRSKNSGALALDQNVVYVVSTDNTIYALNASDGTVRWQARCDGGFGYTAPVAQNGILYLSNATTVYALDANTGEERWRKVVGNTETLALSVANNLVLVRAQDLNSTDGTLLALSATDGKQRWSTPFSSAILSTPALADGAAYLTAVSAVGAETLAALSAADGKQRWQKQLPGGGGDVPLEEQGVVYVDSGGNLLALSAADGTTRWLKPLDGRGFSPGLASASDLLYVGYQVASHTSTSGNDGVVAALSASDGTARWHTAVPGGTPSGVPLAYLSMQPRSGVAEFETPVAAQGVVYVWVQGMVSALDATSGALRWSTAAGDSQASLVA
ncbi:MAG TPA: PQQ-binding-like beta-propeller repeat protein, partial [Ktedonobacterales bacterium]|nr:PQQ-binding-like beta-propeller repeat protein [Ktedonobacterales bacterium]